MSNDDGADAFLAAMRQLRRACAIMNIPPPDLHFDSSSGMALEYNLKCAYPMVSNRSIDETKVSGITIKLDRPHAYRHSIPYEGRPHLQPRGKKC